MAWNQCDGTVAVAAGTVTVICNPSNCSGPVAYAAWGENVPKLSSQEELVKKYDEHIQEMAAIKSRPSAPGGIKKSKSKSYKTSQSVGRGRKYEDFLDQMEMAANGPGGHSGLHGAMHMSDLFHDAFFYVQNPTVKSIAWSPSGCAENGGSLLAAVFDDYSAMLFAPSFRASPLWVPLMDLAPSLLNLKKTQDPEILNAITKGLLEKGETSEWTDAEYAPIYGRLVHGKIINICWSEAILAGGTGGEIYSIIIGITSMGSAHVWKISHVQYPQTGCKDQSLKLSKRVSYMGYILPSGSEIRECKTLKIDGNGDARVVCFFGCTSGEVVCWSVSASELISLPPTYWNGRNLCSMSHLFVIYDPDGYQVTAMDAALRFFDCEQASYKIVVVLGKPTGRKICLISGEILAGELEVEPKLKSNSIIEFDRTPDRHSVTSVACVCDGTMFVVGSRLGNLSTYRVPWDVSDGLTKISNPVHCLDGEGTDAYKGYGCYGIASSPGGYFVAVAQQSLEPGIELSK